MEIEYAKVPDGTKLVFHRNDAFLGNAPKAVPDPPTAADNAPRTPSGLSVRLDGWEELGVTDRAVVEFLFAHGRSRTSEISATTGIPDRTIRDALKRLMERDMVAAHGASHSREYGLKAM